MQFLKKVEEINPVVTFPHKPIQWIGNTAVWPGIPYKTRSDIPSNTTFLFIGDSLSRRLASSLNVFLTKENPTELEFKKDVGGHKTIRHGERVTSIWAPTMSRYMNLKAYEHHDYVIVSIGLHDAGYGGDAAYKLIPKFVERIKHDKVFFRTCPYPDARSKTNLTILDEVNSEIRKLIPSNRIIDGQRLMRGRDVGENRIKGNTREHFGPAGRIALLQLTLINLFS